MEDLDYDQIASSLSELSQHSATPQLASDTNSPHPFDAQDVSFRTSGWLAKVAEVGIWLNLDTPFDSSDPPGTMAAKLFDELTSGNFGDCIKLDGHNALLTEAGAQVLEDRLGRASNNRLLFIEAIEEETSLAAATAIWVEKWNEEPPSEPLSINASVGTWSISDLSSRARRGLLDLNPTYQRDFVWPNAQSQMLVESILRGIPLPSIILAKVSKSNVIQVVDGKQRITAILRFMGAHPDGLAHAESLKEFECFHTDFGKFARRNNLRATELRELYLPFKTRKFTDGNDPLKSLGGKYYCEIKDETIKIAGETMTVADLFEQTTEYHIPHLMYKDTQVRDIHKVFRLYNQQGMKLNAEEIRNAAFNHLTISRLMLFIAGDRPEQEIVKELADFDIDPTSAHENIKALGFGVTRFRRTKVLLWAAATLFLKPSQANDGAFRTPSTAAHIDEFLRSIDDNRLGQFQIEQTLVRLANDMIAALELHEEHEEAWHENFRSKKGVASRWEELPVIASILVCLVLVCAGEDGALKKHSERIRKLTARLQGPKSTQNKTQWAHIANSTMSILDELNVDIEAASETIRKRYGYSAIEALQEIRNIPYE